MLAAAALFVIDTLTLPGLAAHLQPASVGESPIPAPTGPFGVGRVTVHWVDRSRTEVLRPEGGARELMVDVWYPAESTGEPAAKYFDSAAFREPRSAERLRGFLSEAYEPLMAGRVKTHSVQGAPFARSIGRSPVLIFSHGGGEARETYTAQLEDLASHGYVISAITHTYEAVLAVFPDGRHALLASEGWPRPEVSSIEGLPPHHEANPDRLRWWAQDISFVLDRLSRENRSRFSGLPFAGHLDLESVGAFGHSAGGQAAAHACQIDARFQACLNQDGLTAYAPYYLDARGWGMDQAFMLIVRAPRRDPPTEQELEAMKMTGTQAEELLAKLKARQDAALRNTGKGSYRVVLDRETTSHADFTDLPLIQSRNRSQAETKARILETVRRYTRAFFDKYLNGARAPLLEDKIVSEFVESIESFPPASRPGEQH